MSKLPPFGCGHARTDDNLYISADRAVCLTCKRKHAIAYQRKYYRTRYLPEAYRKTLRKLAALESEAKRLGVDLKAERKELIG